MNRDRSRKSKLVLLFAAVLSVSFLLTGQISATSGACLIPTLAADIAIDDFQDEVEVLPEDSKLCKQACNKGRSACISHAKEANSCFNDYAKSAIGIAKIVDCKTEEDKADKKECTQILNDGQKSIKDELKGNLQIAEEDCKEWFDENCLPQCDGEEPSEE